MKKRILSVLMALALCLTLLPAPVWAAEDTLSGGTIVQEEQEEATTEGNGQSTNTGEGEQSNSETNTLTEIWFVRKPDSIGRSYDGTTDGSMVSFGTPQFTDGTNTFELTEGTDFTAKKAFDSADAGNHTVTVEVTLIGEAAAKYKLKAGEENVYDQRHHQQGLSKSDRISFRDDLHGGRKASSAAVCQRCSRRRRGDILLYAVPNISWGFGV